MKKKITGEGYGKTPQEAMANARADLERKRKAPPTVKDRRDAIEKHFHLKPEEVVDPAVSDYEDEFQLRLGHMAYSGIEYRLHPIEVIYNDGSEVPHGWELEDYAEMTTPGFYFRWL